MKYGWSHSLLNKINQLKKNVVDNSDDSPNWVFHMRMRFLHIYPLIICYQFTIILCFKYNHELR